ncbi:hypothetical protein MPSEU_001049700 [Mayamaea pseudoterrestris]|nr:hypothetical protein MPSEU_001049700 [Mayamaea pseudoterrestris]
MFEHEQESTSNAAAADHDDLARTKAKLLGWMSPKPSVDSVFADPVSKAPLLVYVKTSPVVEDASRRRLQYTLTSEDSSRTFAGSSDSYINLLEPVKEVELSPSASNKGNNNILRNTAPFIPPPLRSAVDQDYIPMRDLFTSPAVSFAYERGWRQGFRQAGFPGPDIEADMAMEYFAPTMAARDSRKVLVDMSCATGLFTRRFAESKKYDRVLGCDYSESMLQEAKRRIDRQWKKQSPSNLQLIRLDVGQIPMQNDSIDALHAGAAMHCWPDLPAAVSEIHRVLRPGGRYFATTFLSSYFASLRTLPGEDAGPSRQAFQYFSSTEELRALMEKGGFASEKLSIEVLGAACVIIRAESRSVLLAKPSLYEHSSTI